MDKEQDKAKLSKLSHGDSTTVFWFEEGGGLVYRVEDMYVLFDVPQYGGYPVYDSIWRDNQIDELIERAYSWT